MTRREPSRAKRATRALRTIWSGTAFDDDCLDLADGFRRAYTETSTLCEIEEPDAVADRVVTSMLGRLRERHRSVLGSGAHRRSGLGGSGAADAAGRAIGQELLAEIVLGRASAFAAGTGDNADEISVTLVERLLEALDRPGDTLDPAFKKGVTDALWDFRDALTTPWISTRVRLSEQGRDRVESASGSSRRKPSRGVG